MGYTSPTLIGPSRYVYAVEEADREGNCPRVVVFGCEQGAKEYYHEMCLERWLDEVELKYRIWEVRVGELGVDVDQE